VKDVEEKWLYQIIQEDHDDIEPNAIGEIPHGLSLLVGQN
jgi:hypothetical protein